MYNYAKNLRLIFVAIGLMAVFPYANAEADGEYYPVDGMGVTRPYKVLNGIAYSLSWKNLGEGNYEYYLSATITEPSAIPENLVIPASVYFHGQQDEVFPSIWEFQGEYPVTHINLQDDLSTDGAPAANIKTLYIPESAKDVYFALRNLEYITVDPDNSYYSSANGLLLDKSGQTLEAIPFKMETAIVPEGVETLGNKADWRGKLIGGANSSYTPSLHTVELPGTVKTISPNAFELCANLTDINLPESLIEIKDYAFIYCSSLREISLPSSLLRIENKIFSHTSLQSIAIPENVQEISSRAFGGCEDLIEISVAEDNPYYSSYEGALYDKSMSTLLCIPQGFEGIFTIPESTIKIGDYAYYYPDIVLEPKIKGFVFHDGIKEIGDYAFYGEWVSIELDEFILPKGLERLGERSLNLFRANIIRLPHSLTYISDRPFGWFKTLIAPFEEPIQFEYGTWIQKDKKLIVPPGCVGKYKAAKMWKEFSTISTFELGQQKKVKLGGDMVYQNWLVTATDIPVIGEWTSTDETVAYANDSHLFIATETPGSCTLTFTSEGYSESCDVTVTDEAAQVSAAKDPLKDDVEPEHRVVIDGVSTDGKKLNVHIEPHGIYEYLSWVSSNENIATIDHGLINILQNAPVSFTVEIPDGNSSTINLDGFSGVADITESEQDASCEIYDLQGRRVTAPGHGVFLMKSGTKVTKIVR